MSTYKITVAESDFYNAKNEVKETIVLKNVAMTLSPSKFTFTDLITGEVVEEYSRRRVLHLIRLSNTDAR